MYMYLYLYLYCITKQCYGMLRYATASYSILQHTSAYYSMLQHVSAIKDPDGKSVGESFYRSVPVNRSRNPWIVS